ncbi:MAG: recombination protein RecR [bacterium]|nr:recombination protein RecR [bacterium]
MNSLSAPSNDSLKTSGGSEVEELVRRLGRLPGLGPRSGRRGALYLLTRREEALQPLIQALQNAYENVSECTSCGNLDTINPCKICQDDRRQKSLLCIVETVADLWAIERTRGYKGRYHVLGGHLSALDGVGPEDLNLQSLKTRVEAEPIEEVILALNATVEGQTTAYYVADQLKDFGVKITAVAHGIPLGGELDYLDDGTLTMAMSSRKDL